MNCNNCGNDIAEGAKFCPQCGQEVEVQTAPETENVKEETKSTQVNMEAAQQKADYLPPPPPDRRVQRWSYRMEIRHLFRES